MKEQQAGEPLRPVELGADEDQGPGLLDGLRFLYQKRKQLLLIFISCFVLGCAWIGYGYFRAPTLVQGTVTLRFQGIERGEYPSGKKFSVEDMRNLDLLTQAGNDAGIAGQVPDAGSLSAFCFISPAIPPDVQTRWKKQEKDGVPKEAYFPNEFSIAVRADQLDNSQRLRFFHALVARYRERVKSELKSGSDIVLGTLGSYEKLAARYDYWDMPILFLEQYRTLSQQIENLVKESVQYRDPKYQTGFRSIARDLNAWYTLRLQAVEASTYQGRIVKDRDMTLQRIQHQVGELDLQIKGKEQEADNAERLLGMLERPKATTTGMADPEKGLPAGSTVIDRLIKGEYIRPVVEKISRLQSEIQTLTTSRNRLQKQLEWLPKAGNIEYSQMPPSYRRQVEMLSSEFGAIVGSFSGLVDEYLTQSATNMVAVRQEPIIYRADTSATGAVATVFLISSLFAVALVVGSNLLEKIKSR